MFKPVQRCVYVQATSLNAAQLTQDWFVSKAGLVQSKDLLPGSVFTPAAAIVKTAKLQIIVQPPNVLFYPSTDDRNVLESYVPKFVAVFGAANLLTIGSRFIWHMCELQQTSVNAQDLSRKLFANSIFDSNFPTDKSSFGFVARTSVNADTLKTIDVRTVNVNDSKGPHEHFQISMEFTSTIDGTNLSSIANDHCTEWDKHKGEAEAIVDQIEKAAAKP